MTSSFSITGFLGDMISGIGNYLSYLFSLSAPEFMMALFFDWGWIIVAIILIKAVPIIYLNIINDRYMAAQRYVLLAIDVPRASEQTVKAAENFITALSGGHWAECFREKWLEGQVQRSFGLEIVSIDGHVQFLIHTPVAFRDLVEAAIQAHYPDAEITEVEDYTKEFPNKFPDENYNWKGGEFGLVKSDGIPIRTYKEFEDNLDQEFKDPLVLLLENMSRLGKGEQVWYQLMVRPTAFDWVSKCDAAVDKILGKKPKGSSGLLGDAVSVPGKVVSSFAQAIVGYTPAEAKKSEPKKMLDLTPGEADLIKKIQEKKGKMGFYCKLRVLYLAERSVFKPWRVGGLMGAVKQFNSNTANSLRPNWGTHGTGNDYYFEWRRQKKVAFKQTMVMGYYKKRDAFNGWPPYLLTADEIASLYHFPNTAKITSSLLKKTESKKGEAPVDLPIADEKEIQEVEKMQDQSVVQDWKDLHEISFDLSNDYFEERFAKDKDAYKVKQAARQAEEARLAAIKAEAEARSEEVAADIREGGDSEENLVVKENIVSPKSDIKEAVEVPDKASQFFANDLPKTKEVPEENVNNHDGVEPPANLPI